MKLDWKTRINAVDALEHPYFKMQPVPLEPHEIPHYEESHELDRRKFHDRKAALPPAPKGGTVGLGPDANGATAGFNSSDAYGGRNGMNGNRYRNGPDERRPAWQRDRGPPPRPPPGHPDDPDRGPRGRGPAGAGAGPGPGAGAGRGGGDVDTYIPSYGPNDGARRREDRPPARRRNSRDERRYDRDRRTRSRSRSPKHDGRRDRMDRDVYRR